MISLESIFFGSTSAEANAWCASMRSGMSKSVVQFVLAEPASSRSGSGMDMSSEPLQP
jgi:hypothetical protein